jgi:hypothetical protein
MQHDHQRELAISGASRVVQGEGALVIADAQPADHQIAARCHPSAPSIGVLVVANPEPPGFRVEEQVHCAGLHPHGRSLRAHRPGDDVAEMAGRGG